MTFNHVIQPLGNTCRWIDIYRCLSNLKIKSIKILLRIHFLAASTERLQFYIKSVILFQDQLVPSDICSTQGPILKNIIIPKAHQQQTFLFFQDRFNKKYIYIQSAKLNNCFASVLKRCLWLFAQGLLQVHLLFGIHTDSLRGKTSKQTKILALATKPFINVYFDITPRGSENVI